MTNWSIDILRQTGWDLWVLLSVLASLVLLSYALTSKPWRTALGWAQLLLIALGVGGTAAIVILPALHSPFVGLGWTFCILALLSATFYLNLHQQLGTRRMGTLLAMRLLALAMLVPMLFEPVLRYISRPKPERPICFLVDASGSMSFPDVQNGPTRLQTAYQALRAQSSRLQDHFVPHYYSFATDLEELRSLADLEKKPADGKATDLALAINRARARAGRDDTVIILISDGIDNVSPSVLTAIRGSPLPVHTLRVGSDVAEPATMANVAVENVETAEDFVVGHEAKVKATIKSSALANRVVDVKMAEVDDAGKPKGNVQSQSLVLASVAEGQAVELAYKPSYVGVHRLAVWVDPIAGERNTVDNRQEFQGLAIDPRIKVLYFEGRARPEYKPLLRALERDPQVEVATILRIQKDRFSASGTVDATPFKQVPSTLEEWKKFDVIILGDLDSSWLSKPQQEFIERFTDTGGGLLMIGGQHNFGPGGYAGTAIEKALPVFAGEAAGAQEKSEYVPRLTRDGSAHPAMEGLAEWFGVDDAKPTRELKTLLGNIVVGRPKSGAQVLATHPDRAAPAGGKQVVLAVQRYGQGRSAAFTADTTYRWSLPMYGMGQDSPYRRFWGQLVRWLAGEDVRNRQRGPGVEGLLNKSLYQLGETVRVRAMVRDERGDTTPFAQVSLKLRRMGDRGERQAPLNPVEARRGLYDANLTALDKGAYLVEITATKDNKTLGKQELQFTVIPPAEEMLKLAANPALLASIAAQSGTDRARGFHYELAQLPLLLDNLIRTDQKALGATPEMVPLANAVRGAWALAGRNPRWPKEWNLPMQGVAVVVLLLAEWILRRRWQLP